MNNWLILFLSIDLISTDNSQTNYVLLIFLLNRCLAIKPILSKFLKIPDFREQLKISNYLINS